MPACLAPSEWVKEAGPVRKKWELGASGQGTTGTLKRWGPRGGRAEGGGKRLEARAATGGWRAFAARGGGQQRRD